MSTNYLFHRKPFNWYNIDKKDNLVILRDFEQVISNEVFSELLKLLQYNNNLNDEQSSHSIEDAAVIESQTIKQLPPNFIANSQRQFFRNANPSQTQTAARTISMNPRISPQQADIEPYTVCGSPNNRNNRIDGEEASYQDFDQKFSNDRQYRLPTQRKYSLNQT